jgi:hypothetical protein
MPESLQVSLVMPPTRFIHGAVRSIRQVFYEVVINFLGKCPLPWPGGGGLFCDTGCMAPHPFATGGIQSFPCL